MKIISTILLACLSLAAAAQSTDASSTDPKPLTDKNKEQPDGLALPQNNDGMLNGRITLLNAYKFDFDDTKTANNYVGQLNWLAPRLSRHVLDRLGFNAGLMRINYSLGNTAADTSTAGLVENVKISPLDSMVQGARYLRQINQYRTTTDLSTWSLYAQPMLRLTKDNSLSQVFFHFHTELLAKSYSLHTGVTTLATDTVVYDTLHRPGVIRAGLGNGSTVYHKFVSGYFGAGLTFCLHPWEAGFFFLQPTLGFNTISTTITAAGGGEAAGLRTELKTEGFYLIRASYSHKLTTTANASALVAGVDIRGRLPAFTPDYAVYIGLNVSFDKLLGVITK